MTGWMKAVGMMLSFLFCFFEIRWKMSNEC